jgi:ubiquinone/menaquinone biosynthesis C-methylase UbiE
MSNKVSEIDIFNLQIIRNGVKSLIQEAAINDSSDLVVLDIAPQIHNGAREFFKNAKIMTLDIDIDSGADFIADLCENNSEKIPSNFFDVIICTEVLEHTLNPFNAVAEMHRLLKSNGKVYVSTPFNFRIHGPLPDCWRFTKYGLTSLFSKFDSVDIKETESEDRFLMPIQYYTIATK